jgi:hypothetical protein
MFELHVVVAGIVIFNIMELIMEIMPNYPTLQGGASVAGLLRWWRSASVGATVVADASEE